MRAVQRSAAGPEHSPVANGENAICDGEVLQFVRRVLNRNQHTRRERGNVIEMHAVENRGNRDNQSQRTESLVRDAINIVKNQIVLRYRSPAVGGDGALPTTLPISIAPPTWLIRL